MCIRKLIKLKELNRICQLPFPKGFIMNGTWKVVEGGEFLNGCPAWHDSACTWLSFSLLSVRSLLFQAFDDQIPETHIVRLV